MKHIFPLGPLTKDGWNTMTVYSFNKPIPKKEKLPNLPNELDDLIDRLIFHDVNCVEEKYPQLIQEYANDIWKHRVKYELPGSAESDWETAKYEIDEAIKYRWMIELPDPDYY